MGKSVVCHQLNFPQTKIIDYVAYCATAKFLSLIVNTFFAQITMLEGTQLVVYLHANGRMACKVLATDVPRSIRFCQSEDFSDGPFANEVHDSANRFYGIDAATVLPSVLGQDYYDVLMKLSSVRWRAYTRREQASLCCVPYNRLNGSRELCGQDVFTVVPSPPESIGADFGAPTVIVCVNQVHPTGNQKEQFPLITIAFGAYMDEMKDFEGTPVNGETFVPFALDKNQQKELLAAARDVYNASLVGYDKGVTPATMNAKWGPLL